MHEMQTIVTNVSCVCLSVCLLCSSSRLHCAKMAEQIKILIGMNSHWGPWNIVLDWGHDPPQEGDLIQSLLNQFGLVSIVFRYLCFVFGVVFYCVCLNSVGLLRTYLHLK